MAWPVSSTAIGPKADLCGISFGAAPGRTPMVRPRGHRAWLTGYFGELLAANCTAKLVPALLTLKPSVAALTRHRARRFFLSAPGMALDLIARGIPRNVLAELLLAGLGRRGCSCD